MSSRCLDTCRAVVKALDGIAAVAALTGSQPKAISAALARGYFPAKFYLVMTQALSEKDFTAPAALWQQVGGEAMTLAQADTEATKKPGITAGL